MAGNRIVITSNRTHDDEGKLKEDFKKGRSLAVKTQRDEKQKELLEFKNNQLQNQSSSQHSVITPREEEALEFACFMLSKSKHLDQLTVERVEKLNPREVCLQLLNEQLKKTPYDLDISDTSSNEPITNVSPKKVNCFQLGNVKNSSLLYLLQTDGNLAVNQGKFLERLYTRADYKNIKNVITRLEKGNPPSVPLTSSAPLNSGTASSSSTSSTNSAAGMGLFSGEGSKKRKIDSNEHPDQPAVISNKRNANQNQPIIVPSDANQTIIVPNLLAENEALKALVIQLQDQVKGLQNQVKGLQDQVTELKARETNNSPNLSRRQ